MTAHPDFEQYDDDLPVVCIAENRASCEPPVRLLIASLLNHCPKVRIEVFFPNSSEAFEEWICSFPTARLNTQRLSGEWRGYSIKPSALLSLLRSGYSDVVWLDSDIIIAGDPFAKLRNLPPDLLVITEEALGTNHPDHEAFRARQWGFEVGRILQITFNSAVLRVTHSHLPLLERWEELLRSDLYLEAQQLPWQKRPIHLLGDQEVLTALLASTEFAHLPIKLLRRGIDVLQFFGPYGYTLRERIHTIRQGLPPLVHSQGARPWWNEQLPKSIFSYSGFSELYKLYSPYLIIAERYKHHLSDAAWLDARSRSVAFSRWLGNYSACLPGITLAAAADLSRLVRHAKRSISVPRR